jgi:hypothetical protein
MKRARCAIDYVAQTAGSARSATVRCRLTSCSGDLWCGIDASCDDSSEDLRPPLGNPAMNVCRSAQWPRQARQVGLYVVHVAFNLKCCEKIDLTTWRKRKCCG